MESAAEGIFDASDNFQQKVRDGALVASGQADTIGGVTQFLVTLRQERDAFEETVTPLARQIGSAKSRFELAAARCRKGR